MSVLLADACVHQVELNEIESSCEEYPLTRAFCQLISTLVESSLPVNLGAGLRAPGFDPYLAFLRDAVFLPFPTRAYCHAAEKVAFFLTDVCAVNNALKVP